MRDVVRRFALYSDIHGNSAALDAVYADMAAAGVTERYCLGDLVGYGPDPAGVIERVRASGDLVIRGNYDDGVGRHKGDCGCYYATPEARADGEASYAFTDSALSPEEHSYLGHLADELRFEADGVRVVLVHGSPRKINEYLLPDRTNEFLGKLAERADADLVCVGHVHVPYRRVVTTPGGRIAYVVSDGSVGKPKDGDPRACWTEIAIGTAEEIDAFAKDDPVAENAGGALLGVSFHRVSYDVPAVAAAMRDAGLPDRLADALLAG